MGGDGKRRQSKPGSRRRALYVVAPDGGRQRFLPGMITHDLIQRGFEFDDAYATARAIRDRLGTREQVSESELRDLIAQQLHEMFGGEVPRRSGHGARRPADLQVIYHGERQPFSRGLLARSIQASGVDLDRAYRLVTELESRIRKARQTVLSSDEIARQVGDLLDSHESRDVARRYRLVRQIHRMPRPLVIYLAGASGTGKSTLALELAPLLRIYRINATDTIRQVMRMIFTPSILPALHSSSFEIAATYEVGSIDQRPGISSDPQRTLRLIASFEEQATRVCVGVRAVVERAIAENMSIVVEGVHLHPGLVPFPDLEGAVCQVPLMLVTLNREAHRTRFLARSRIGARRAERYLENFASIRAIHEHLLHQAEAHDVPLVDTSDGEATVARALRCVTGILETRVSSFGRGAGRIEPDVPTLLLLIDGMADRPVRALGERTPLQAARTPTLDRLAREGQTGLADPVAPGVVPDTASGSLAALGQSPQALRRGPVEALGAGIVLDPEDIALRGNFATVDHEGRLIDRRAGRIRDDAEELAAAIDGLALPAECGNDVQVRVAVGTEHRLAIVLRGEGLSSAIVGSDPGDGAAHSPPLVPRPIDAEDEGAVRTARWLALFEAEANRVLCAHPLNLRRIEAGLPPANTVLTRGAGRAHRLIPLETTAGPLRLACISGDCTILGLAGWLGAETITSEAMTANLDTDLEAKFVAALEALKRVDLVVLHVKGADIAAHDRRPDQKVQVLEQVDLRLAWLLERHVGPLRVAVASDHATLSEPGLHSADPPPVLIWGSGIEADSVVRFDEFSAAAGKLRRFPLQTLLGHLFDLA